MAHSAVNVASVPPRLWPVLRTLPAKEYLMFRGLDILEMRGMRIIFPDRQLLTAFLLLLQHRHVPRRRPSQTTLLDQRV
jgi:hypothetical protein